MGVAGIFTEVFMKLSSFICAGLLVCASGAAFACEGTQLEALYRINRETEAKLQLQVLDRILGPGRAFVFLEMKAEVKSSVSQDLKGGVGETRVMKPKEQDAGAAAAPAAKDPKEVATQEQRASQERKSSESTDVLSLSISYVTVRILHENTVPSVKLQAVKNALAALYPGRIDADAIVLVPVVFDIQSLR